MLTEATTTLSVNIDTINSEACVMRETKVFRDGVEIASTPRKQYYNQTELAAFLLEVEGAENYAAALGWVA